MKEREIRYLAHLARIQLTDAEVEKIKADLNQLLEYVGKLQSLPTEDAPPTYTALSSYNRFRKDEIKPSFPTEKVLANAPARKGNFFRVPRVITHGG